jgi:hypothetical protein
MTAATRKKKRPSPPDTFFVVRLLDAPLEDQPYEGDEVEAAIEAVFGEDVASERSMAMPFSEGEVGDHIGYVARQGTAFAAALEGRRGRAGDEQTAESEAVVLPDSEMNDLLRRWATNFPTFIVSDERSGAPKVVDGASLDVTAVQGLVCVQCDAMDAWDD